MIIPLTTSYCLLPSEREWRDLQRHACLLVRLFSDRTNHRDMWRHVLCSVILEMNLTEISPVTSYRYMKLLTS
jgi:hypothetical protein